MFKKVSLFIVLISIAGSCYAFKVPTLTGHVNDYAHILSKEMVDELENKLQLYEKTTTRQFVVLTLDNIQGKTIEEAANLIANQAKIGEKKTDNGLLLLIAMKERKIRIEVGSGIEDEYTDVFTGRVIDDILTPYLKSGKYDKGVKEAVEALVSEIKATAPDNDGSYLFLIFVAVVIVLIILALASDEIDSGSGGGGYIGGGRSRGNWSSSGGGRSSGGSGFSGRGGGFSGGGSSGSF